MKIKSLKFYLELGGKAVYTLDELENNFYFQEIITYYQSGVLTRWLKALGEDEKANALEEKIAEDEKDKCLILKTLLEVLELTATPESIKAMERIVTYEQINNDNSIVGDPKVIEQSVLDSYFERYEKLKEKLRSTDEESSQLEMLAKQFAQDFFTALEIDYRNILEDFQPVNHAFCAALFKELLNVSQSQKCIFETLRYVHKINIPEDKSAAYRSQHTFLKGLCSFSKGHEGNGNDLEAKVPALSSFNVKYLKGDDVKSLEGKNIFLIALHHCQIRLADTLFETIYSERKLFVERKIDLRELQGTVTSVNDIGSSSEVLYVEL